MIFKVELKVFCLMMRICRIAYLNGGEFVVDPTFILASWRALLGRKKKERSALETRLGVLHCKLRVIKVR